MKQILFCMLCMVALSLQGQTKPNKLRFNTKGEFKVVQFTDVHYVPGKPEESKKALECIDQVLDAEQPDLVVLTGDIIYGSPAEEAMRTVLQRVSDHQVPFVATLGNHDDEQEMKRADLYRLISSWPCNLQLAEQTDFVVPVAASDGSKTTALLYIIDSHSYSTLPDAKGYAWIDGEQINWYRTQSRQYAEQNGGTPLPALAFFHIPLPEYGQAARSEGCILRGNRMEPVCSPVLNSGLFTAIKEQGDVMGCFVGHDHDNDYAAMWHKVLLAYGRYTGGNTVYNHLPNGARVIVLKEGQRAFNTWIRLRTGEIEQPTTYPDSFVKQ
ncbi:MAG: metallophosphoesterase family protein [Mediterranea sp.]|nr:metallophosphoesterase family protein [Mediterranea sp.]